MDNKNDAFLCPLCQGKGYDTGAFTQTLGKKTNLVECQSCDHVFVAPMPTEEELFAYYRTSRSEHTEKYPKDHAKTLKRIQSILRDESFSLEGRSIMEIGPGSEGILPLIKECSRYIAVEPCEESRKTLQNTCEKRGVPFWAYPTIDAVPQSERADLIISIFSLEHIPDPKGFMKKLCDFLADEGVFLLCVPDRSREIPLLGLGKGEISFCNTHLQSFSTTSLEKLFSEISLRVVCRGHFLPLFMRKRAESFIYTLRKLQDSMCLRSLKYSLRLSLEAFSYALALNFSRLYISVNEYGVMYILKAKDSKNIE